MGANQSYIEQKIPHVAALMCESIDEVISQSDIILIGNKAEEFQRITNEMVGDKLVFDLVRIELNKNAKGNYIGLAW
jgi:GDP-mannose 6-dehydrogenase